MADKIIVPCPFCDGGVVRHSQYDNPTEGGAESIVETPCPHCSATGEKVFGSLEALDGAALEAGLTKIWNKCKAILAAVEALNK